jgi:predicted ArsR family transcriptional regulator
MAELVGISENGVKYHLKKLKKEQEFQATIRWLK